MKRPTNRMQQYLEAIREFIYKNGYSPTIRELRDKLNVTSTATIQNMLMRMREKGLIDFEDYKQRTIRILDNKKIIATKEELIKMGYYQVIEEKDKEIERLNNIINELEKICKDHIDIKIKTHCGKYYFDVEDILETIEVLKENKND